MPFGFRGSLAAGSPSLGSNPLYLLPPQSGSIPHRVLGVHKIQLFTPGHVADVVALNLVRRVPFLDGHSPVGHLTHVTHFLAHNTVAEGRLSIPARRIFLVHPPRCSSCLCLTEASAPLLMSARYC